MKTFEYLQQIITFSYFIPIHWQFISIELHFLDGIFRKFRVLPNFAHSKAEVLCLSIIIYKHIYDIFNIKLKRSKLMLRTKCPNVLFLLSITALQHRFKSIVLESLSRFVMNHTSSVDMCTYPNCPMVWYRYCCSFLCVLSTEYCIRTYLIDIIWNQY